MGNRNFTRREFMATITAGAGTVFVGGKALNLGETETSLKSFDPFETVTLGKTGIRTTLLGMGTGYNGYNRSSSITRAGNAESMIHAAYERGIRYFDCADTYGTHPFVKAALKNYPRDSYVIGTKMWVTEGGIPEKERPDAEIVVDRFRKELDTDYIDLLQLHCMTTGEWSDQQKRYMEGLENLKAKKIIKAHGLSVHSFDALKVASETPWVDVIHVRINPYGESMDNRNASLVVPVIEKLHKAGKGVIGMKLIGGGALRNDSDKIGESLKFVLGLGTVDLIIVGFESPEHIDNYIERIRNIRIS
jgi:aryl-alcohol dehydrogenase-like predicted oxidoreductase